MIQANKRMGSTGGSRGSYTGSVDEEVDEDRMDKDEGDEEASLNPKKLATKVNKRANLGTVNMDNDTWRA